MTGECLQRKERSAIVFRPPSREIAHGCCCCVAGVGGSMVMLLLPLTEDRALAVLAGDKGKIQINESCLPTGVLEKEYLQV